MKFFDEVRQYITLSNGTRTFIATEAKESSLLVKFATPMVRAYDKIFRSAGEEIQPKQVSRVSMFGDNHEEVMRETRATRLDNVQDKSEQLRGLASENLSLAKELLEQAEAESNSWSLKRLWNKFTGKGESIPYKEFEDSLSVRKELVQGKTDSDSISTISDCDLESATEELVSDREVTDSILDCPFYEISLRSESANMAIESHLNSANLESGHTPGLTPEPSEKEKSGLFKKFKELFTKCFSAEPTESSDSVHMMYGKTFKHANGLEYNQTRAEIMPLKPNAHGSCREEADCKPDQGRGATPPPAYEEAIKGKGQPNSQLGNLGVTQRRILETSL